MYIKIKKLREYLELSQAQISKLLNISTYKYKRFEDGTLYIDSECLIILSILYAIPMDYLIFDKYSISDIIKLSSIIELKMTDASKRILCMEKRIVTKGYKKVTYRTISTIIKKTKKQFGKNLFKLRTQKNIDIYEISNQLEVSMNEIIKYEHGIVFPPIEQLITISIYMQVQLQCLLNV